MSIVKINKVEADAKQETYQEREPIKGQEEVNATTQVKIYSTTTHPHQVNMYQATTKQCQQGLILLLAYALGETDMPCIQLTSSVPNVIPGKTAD
jgi:hypothetical protein